MSQERAEILNLEYKWKSDPRWLGIVRPYKAEDVYALRGGMGHYARAAKLSANLYELIKKEKFVRALGTLSGLQALGYAMGGLKTFYVSGWQIAAANNSSGHMYPDLSLYPSDSGARLIDEIYNTLESADAAEKLDGKFPNWSGIPAVLDLEAGFGDVQNVAEVTRWAIKAGAAGIHLEDQLSAKKKCGHMGGKVLVSTQTAVQKLVAARLIADIMKVPVVIIARTDAEDAEFVENDADAADHKLLTGERSSEGYFVTKGGMEAAIARALSYAPYADMLWFETSKPDIQEAEEFASAIHEKFPGKWLAYNCSPSFNWRKNLTEDKIASFQEDLAKIGYKFQFVTLAGFHLVLYHSFNLAKDYGERGMSAYTALQEAEFAAEKSGFDGVKHQRRVGANWYDNFTKAVTGGKAQTLALKNSTEEKQF